MENPQSHQKSVWLFIGKVMKRSPFVNFSYFLLFFAGLQRTGSLYIPMVIALVLSTLSVFWFWVSASNIYDTNSEEPTLNEKEMVRLYKGKSVSGDNQDVEFSWIETVKKLVPWTVSFIPVIYIFGLMFHSIMSSVIFSLILIGISSICFIFLKILSSEMVYKDYARILPFFVNGILFLFTMSTFVAGLIRGEYDLVGNSKRNTLNEDLLKMGFHKVYSTLIFFVGLILFNEYIKNNPIQGRKRNKRRNIKDYWVVFTSSIITVTTSLLMAVWWNFNLLNTLIVPRVGDLLKPSFYPDLPFLGVSLFYEKPISSWDFITVFVPFILMAGMSTAFDILSESKINIASQKQHSKCIKYLIYFLVIIPFLIAFTFPFSYFIPEHFWACGVFLIIAFFCMELHTRFSNIRSKVKRNIARDVVIAVSFFLVCLMVVYVCWDKDLIPGYSSTQAVSNQTDSSIEASSISPNSTSTSTSPNPFPIKIAGVPNLSENDISSTASTPLSTSSGNMTTPLPSGVSNSTAEHFTNGTGSTVAGAQDQKDEGSLEDMAASFWSKLFG